MFADTRTTHRRCRRDVGADEDARAGRASIRRRRRRQHLRVFLRNAEARRICAACSRASRPRAPARTADRGESRRPPGPRRRRAAARLIQAYPPTNSIIITAPPASTARCAGRRQLDLRRAQVYVEALIVEVSDRPPPSSACSGNAVRRHRRQRHRQRLGGTNFTARRRAQHPRHRAESARASATA